MKRILFAVLASTVLLIGGCSLLPRAADPLPVDTTKSIAEQAAQKSINELYVNLTAAYNLVDLLAKEGALTKTETGYYLRQLDSYRDKLLAVETLLKAGKALEAKTEAELQVQLLLFVQKEISERKKRQ